jgi:hypothetical protein
MCNLHHSLANGSPLKTTTLDYNQPVLSPPGAGMTILTNWKAIGSNESVIGFDLIDRGEGIAELLPKARLAQRLKDKINNDMKL